MLENPSTLSIHGLTSKKVSEKWMIPCCACVTVCALYGGSATALIVGLTGSWTGTHIVPTCTQAGANWVMPIGTCGKGDNMMYIFGKLPTVPAQKSLCLLLNYYTRVQSVNP